MCAHTGAFTRMHRIRITALNLHGNSPHAAATPSWWVRDRGRRKGKREKKKEAKGGRQRGSARREGTREEGKKMLRGDTQGARQRPRDRGWEGSGGEGDKIKDGCLFIHNFLFIQNARLPSGSPCYVSVWEGIKKGEGAGVRGVDTGWGQVKEGGDGEEEEKTDERSIQSTAFIPSFYCWSDHMSSTSSMLFM